VGTGLHPKRIHDPFLSQQTASDKTGAAARQRVRRIVVGIAHPVVP